jgi:hypothetical protein
MNALDKDIQHQLRRGQKEFPKSAVLIEALLEAKKQRILENSSAQQKLASQSKDEHLGDDKEVPLHKRECKKVAAL